MANVTLKGQSHSHRRPAPQGRPRGPQVPCHSRRPQRNISLADFEGKVEILNIVPILDTGLGAASSRRFEKEAGLGRRTTPPSWRGWTAPSTGRGSSTRGS